MQNADSDLKEAIQCLNLIPFQINFQQWLLLKFRHSGTSESSWCWRMVFSLDNGKMSQGVVCIPGFSLFFQLHLSLMFSPVFMTYQWEATALIKKTCQLLGIKKTRTTPYHPQSDGLVERFNRTLLNMLSTAVMDDEHSWDLHLPTLLLAYRTSVQETTATVLPLLS